MEMIRPSAVAGLFYPADADKLAELIKQDISGSAIQTELTPKALIVPHAGYLYSGEVAASAYITLKNIAEHIKHVLLIGPSHRVPFNGVALTESDWFETPLGLVQVDRQTNGMLTELPDVQVLELAHAHEHSIEVQLPFLQMLLNDFTITPIVVGSTAAESISNIIETATRPDTLIVISSDLSHYLDYESAKEVDQLTSEAILNTNLQIIDGHHACGSIGIKGLLLYAKKHHLSSQILDLRNSGDTAGKKDSVVGYGAYIFH